MRQKEGMSIKKSVVTRRSLPSPPGRGVGRGVRRNSTFLCNGLQNMFHIFPHCRIGESHNRKSFLFKIALPTNVLVLVCFFKMHSTIDFDDEPVLHTQKIRDVGIHGDLSSEFESLESFP